ncbi:MAG: hypothetical protein P8X70_01515 [Nanoarchaeota archaeon]
MKLLIQPPSKKYKKLWLEIYAKKSNKPVDKLFALYKYFKDDLFLILSVLELISNDEANDIKVMIEASDFIMNNNNTFENKINSLSIQYKISTNKIYKLYKFGFSSFTSSGFLQFPSFFIFRQ